MFRTTESLARRIVHELGGDWHGSGGLVPGLGHSARDRSVSIKDHPGSAGDVLVHAFSGDDPLAFKAELRLRGLLPALEGRSRVARAVRERVRHVPPKTPILSEDQQRRRGFAQRIWDEVRSPLDTAAALYLAEARGIAPPWPSSLGFHPRCPRGSREAPLPALVAAVTVPTTGGFRAVHRIYLRPDGRGKADLPRDEQKRTLGPSSCAAVVLGDLAVGAAIVEGEGIETVLTVCVALGLPGVATLSLSALGRAPLPAGRPIVILADRGGEAGARRAAMVRAAEGRVVRLMIPPAGSKDFNDLVKVAP